MKLAKICGLFAVVLMAMAVSVTSASAAGVLPEFSKTTTFTGLGGAAKLNLTGAAIQCSSSTSLGTGLTTKTGEASLLFKGCKLGGKQCKTAGSGTETIKVAGKYQLVRITTLKAGILLEPTVTKIECEFAAAKEVTVEGTVIAGITPVLTSTKSFALPLNVASEKQEFETYENDTPAKVTAKLVGKIGTGENKSATMESASNSVTTVLAVEITKTT